MEDNTLFNALNNTEPAIAVHGKRLALQNSCFPVTRTSRLATLCSTATRLDTENRQLFAEDLLEAFRSMHRLDSSNGADNARAVFPATRAPSTCKWRYQCPKKSTMIAAAFLVLR
jgi:hypothetical protein